MQISLKNWTRVPYVLACAMTGTGIVYVPSRIAPHGTDEKDSNGEAIEMATHQACPHALDTARGRICRRKQKHNAKSGETTVIVVPSFICGDCDPMPLSDKPRIELEYTSPLTRSLWFLTAECDAEDPTPYQEMAEELRVASGGAIKVNLDELQDGIIYFRWHRAIDPDPNWLPSAVDSMVAVLRKNCRAKNSDDEAEAPTEVAEQE